MITRGEWLIKEAHYILSAIERGAEVNKYRRDIYEWLEEFDKPWSITGK